jgi:hypothetical protein
MPARNWMCGRESCEDSLTTRRVIRKTLLEQNWPLDMGYVIRLTSHVYAKQYFHYLTHPTERQQHLWTQD